MYDTKPYKNHSDDAPISMYILSDDAPLMEKVSCVWCKRTIIDMKGRIDSVINTPMPLHEYDIAINVRCKLCHANYRLLINAHQ